MNIIDESLLGKQVSYASQYDASLLFPITRISSRQLLGIDSVQLPFTGLDIWNAYELSWLDRRGKPKVAIAELHIPATSPNLIESKSLKLYLNSFVQTTIDSSEVLRGRLITDLSAVAGVGIDVTLTPVTAREAIVPGQLQGELIDDLPITIDHYGPPQPSFLTADGEPTREALVSHLLKSNCPVTGQPDWASVQIYYEGSRINRAGLLRYLLSYRQHSDFHEACVERIFIDIQKHCQPRGLSVYARYTRRGGLDINPFRATTGMPVPTNLRLARQ